MQIKIRTEQLNSVADSLGSYIEKDLVENDERLNMFWYCGSLDLVQRIQKEAEKNSDNDYSYVEVDNRLLSDLQTIMEKYIFAEIKELGSGDREWMIEMANLYLQFAMEEKKFKKINENKESNKVKDKENIEKDTSTYNNQKRETAKSKKINIF